MDALEEKRMRDCIINIFSQTSVRKMALLDVFSALETYLVADSLQFAFLKLGSRCNANQTRPFNEAECDMQIIKDADGYYLSVGFSQLFQPGYFLLNKLKAESDCNLTNYEKYAIDKLVGFLKQKGRQGGAMKGR